MQMKDDVVVGLNGLELRYHCLQGAAAIEFIGENTLIGLRDKAEKVNPLARSEITERLAPDPDQLWAVTDTLSMFINNQSNEMPRGLWKEWVREASIQEAHNKNPLEPEGGIFLQLKLSSSPWYT